MTAVLHQGRRVALKWHRARRRAGDPPFTARRIAEGMRMGASVEVDLVVHRGGLAVLHDLDLDRATTGTGPLREATAEALRTLRLRGPDGAPLPDPVLLLDDLAALAAGAHPDALLQLDFKEGQALDGATVAAFARAVGPFARHAILSSGDRSAVQELAAAVPGLRVGHDPCHFGAMARLRADGDVAAFVSRALADAPDAAVIYLYHALALWAAGRGSDLVGPFQAAGRRVDAYTIARADAEGVALARRLLALGVDQVTTDDPEGLAAAL